MGVLGKYGASALKYWGSIIDSAYRRQPTARVWDAIHADQARYGLPTAQTQGPDVSVLRGFANRIVNGAKAFAAANPTDSLTPDMMATAPYTSRDQASIDTNPVYHVRGITVVEHADGTITGGWFTARFTASQMASTVGGVIDAFNLSASEQLARAAQMTGGLSGGKLIDSGNYEITLVLPDGRASSLPQQQ